MKLHACACKQMEDLKPENILLVSPGNDIDIKAHAAAPSAKRAEP